MRVRRGAVVAAVVLVAVLAGLAGHPDGILRGHAAWALGRIGGRAAEEILWQRLAVEESTAVERQIRGALEGGEAPSG